MLILLMIRQCIIWESGDINVGKESLGHGFVVFESFVHKGPRVMVNGDVMCDDV